jgi:hypothetical protein
VTPGVLVASSRVSDEAGDHGNSKDASSSSCSCFNTLVGERCCQRAVIRAHKFGWILAEEFFAEAFPDVQLIEVSPQAFPDYAENGDGTEAKGNRADNDDVYDDDDNFDYDEESEKEEIVTSREHKSPPRTSRDYRHAFLTRNFFEAFVSGYQYHKTGRECWMDSWGNPVVGYEENLNWERYLIRSGYDLGGYPPRRGRSICQYLIDETEEDGMKVYIASALSMWYFGLDSYLRIERKRRWKRPRTRFFCLEDASTSDGRRSTFYRMVAWLYPGGHNFSYPEKSHSSKEASGHANDPNPIPRKRLLELVKRYDREIFNGTIAATNRLLRCNGTIPDRL